MPGMLGLRQKAAFEEPTANNRQCTFRIPHYDARFIVLGPASRQVLREHTIARAQVAKA